MITSYLFVIIVQIILCGTGSNALRITLLDIPSPLVMGESAELTCNYDLDDHTLYSFKWYKDGFEFYRYVPRDYPQIQYLKIAGINVDVRKSTKKSVFLHSVNLATRGKYRCEISAEAPSFITAAKEGFLDINVLPTQGPKVVAEQSKYTVGDEMVVNCTSDRSNMEIHLNFSINGEPVLNSIDYELTFWTQLHADSLRTAGLSLRFTLTSRHFRSGKLKLKCIATLSERYNLANEANLLITDYKYRPEPIQFVSSESQGKNP
ncbi:hypothetical protein BLOT_007214 [Blomia tropicalis]|nr:hypothetical protein BLOT_007214 [Blomia tropicalis]